MIEQEAKYRIPEETNQTITYGEPVHIKLGRGQKGGYGWEIGVRGTDGTWVLQQIEAIDRALRQTYLKPEEDKDA